MPFTNQTCGTPLCLKSHSFEKVLSCCTTKEISLHLFSGGTSYHHLGRTKEKWGCRGDTLRNFLGSHPSPWKNILFIAKGCFYWSSKFRIPPWQCLLSLDDFGNVLETLETAGVTSFSDPKVPQSHSFCFRNLWSFVASAQCISMELFWIIFLFQMFNIE